MRDAVRVPETRPIRRRTIDCANARRASSTRRRVLLKPYEIYLTLPFLKSILLLVDEFEGKRKNEKKNELKRNAYSMAYAEKKQ